MSLLFVVAAVITAFVALYLVFFQATRKTYPGFGYWTAGVGILAIGYLLYALRGIIPLWISVFLGTVSFPLGMVLHLDGIRRFLGLKPASRLWYALPVGVLAAMAVFYFHWDSFVWRGFVASVPITAIHWTMAALLFRNTVPPRSTFYQIIGSLLILGGFLILARALWLVSAQNTDLFWKAPLEFAFFISFVVLHLGENLSLIMLNAERVESELLDAKAELSHTVRSLEEALIQQKQTEESLRDSEERYRTFFDTSRDCVFMTTVDGRFIDFNEATLEMLGYSLDRRAELLGKRTRDLYANPEEREIHAALAAELGFSKEYPVDLRKQDGTIIHTLVTTVAQKDPEGNLIGFQGTVRDITERKKAEEQIKASLKEKEILLREIHHRVKNNLTLVCGLLTLQAEYADEKHRRLFEELEARVMSMAVAHEKLYKSESLANLNVEEYIGELIDHLVGSTRLRISIQLRKEIQGVSFGLDTAIPVGFIVTELVSNCLKHAFPDSREGEIYVSLRSIGEKELELVVSDNGVGIPEEIDLVNSPSLGMDLVNAFVTKLKGSMEIRENDGTEIRLRFREV